MKDPRQLRRTGPWQVAVLLPPEEFRDGEVAAIVLVLDVRANRIRTAGPLEDLSELSDFVVEAAVTPPADVKPARPRSLVCLPAHAALLADASRQLGCTVTPSKHMKEADAALQHLTEYLAPAQFGMPQTDAPWPQLMATAFADPPWAQLDDAHLVTLRSEHNELDGRVVAVMGQAGMQLGFAIYPNLQAYERFVEETAHRDPNRLTNLEALLVHYDPTEELEKATVSGLLRAGLVHHDKAQQLYRFADGELQPMSPVEEQTTAAVVDAVLKVWNGHRASLLQPGIPATVQTFDGREVAVSIAFDEDLFAHPTMEDGLVFEDPPILTRHNHLMFVARFSNQPPLLVFKYNKQHALQIADEVVGIDRLELLPGPMGSVALVGWEGDRRIGLLTVHSQSPDHTEFLLQQDEIQFAISAGGAVRRSFSPRDVVYQNTVTVSVSPIDSLDTSAFEPGFSELDPDGALRGKDWSGPLASWPAASAALMAFGGPLQLLGAPLAVATRSYEVLSLIWNAVVLADHDNAPEVLSSITMLAKDEMPADLTDLLIERKRRLFAEDCRLITVNDVSDRDGIRNVKVDWTLPRSKDHLRG